MMHFAHHPIYVVLSISIAIFGSWTALDLFRRVRAHTGRARMIWLATASVAMGVSIWSMHFIAMLGFDPGSPVRYDQSLTLLSLVLAIGATAIAFFAAARRGGAVRLGSFGVLMGAGICLMHYVGMAAVRSAVSLGYEPMLVALSFAIAAGASTAALIAAARERSPAWRGVAAVVLGLAIVGMHYTAMAALRLTPDPSIVVQPSGLDPMLVATGTTVATMVLLFLALIASVIDRRLDVFGALEAGEVGYWELSLPNMTLHTSDKAKAILGRSPDRRLTLEDLGEMVHPDDREAREAAVRAGLSGGAPYDNTYRITRPDGSVRWINVRGRVAGGYRRRLIGVVLDVTDRVLAAKAAETQQRLLINELNHRVKNTLATVQSIAAQTARRATSVPQFREAFEARLVALSQTHDLLTRTGWERADVRDLVLQEMRPYAEAQVRIEGPGAKLSPAVALSLGMVFHELATNAAKYGALSTADGCVRVGWSAGDCGLTLTWQESGGPAVSASRGEGFGSQLIRRTVEGGLRGKVDIDYRPRGLTCRIEIPLREEASVFYPAAS